MAWTIGRLLGSGALALLAVQGLVSSGASAQDHRAAEDLVVMIEGDLGDASTAGAGILFGVGDDRLYIATARHVVEPRGRKVQSVRVRFKWLPGEWVTAQLLDHRADLDLAVLAVPDPSKYAALRKVRWDALAAPETLKPRSHVFPIGYPEGREWLVVMQPHTVARITTGTRIETEGKLSPGHSGGALVTEDGRIAGLITHDGRELANVSVPIDRVIEQLKEWHYPVTLTSRPSSPPSRPVEAPPSADPVKRIVRAAPSDGVIYAINRNNDLLWYRHVGHAGGTVDWAANEGKGVGNGWAFSHVFSGGDGVTYAINKDAQLVWYRHTGFVDGTYQWLSWDPKVVGAGWNVQHVFSGGDGVIYAIVNGTLMWNRHEGRDDGTFRWAAPTGVSIASGWNFRHVFSTGDGVIYGIRPNGDVLWHRHDGQTDGSARWTSREGKIVDSGWDVKRAFAGRGGVIYSVDANNHLIWNRHEGRDDGTVRWAGKRIVGTGWDFRIIFSGTLLP